MQCVLFAFLIQRLINVLTYILIDSSRPTNSQYIVWLTLNVSFGFYFNRK